MCAYASLTFFIYSFFPDSLLLMPVLTFFNLSFFLSDSFSPGSCEGEEEEPPVAHFLTEAGPQALDKLENLIKLPFFLLNDGDEGQTEVIFIRRTQPARPTFSDGKKEG